MALRDGWVAQIFTNGFRTFWGTFGWGNVPLPDWAYLAFLVITLVGVIGFVAAVWRANATRRFVLIGLVACFVSLLLPSLAQAVFFPKSPNCSLDAISCPHSAHSRAWWRGGFAFWFHARTTLATWGNRLLSAALALFALVVPLAYLQPVYATPIVNASPASALPPTLLTFENEARQPVAEFISATANFVYLQDREGPRPYAHVKLMWRALQRTNVNFCVWAERVGLSKRSARADQSIPSRRQQSHHRLEPRRSVRRRILYPDRQAVCGVARSSAHQCRRV